MEKPQPGNRITELAEKYMNGTITPEEEQELMHWYDQVEEEVPVPAAFARDEAALRSRILKNMQQQMHRPRRRRWRAVAAAAILLLGGSISLFLWNKADQPTGGSLAGEANQEILPGGNRATLTLADGSVITLDSALNGTLASQGGSRVIKLDSGQLSYAGGASAAHGGEILYNTIRTPRGGQYQVVLPDGTRIWLNAVSSVRFPVAFAATERRIQVTGEVYLEVAQNQQAPFIVEVPPTQPDGTATEVQVLGTHFNIMAYPDEAALATTLLQGAVKVKQGNAAAMLQPGRQAAIDLYGKITVQPVDTEEVIAWKNGMLQYTSANIEAIMRQVARWYDVDVVYKGNMVNKDFACIVSRKEKVKTLLDMLELTGSVHFTIEGRTIIVTP